MAEADALPCFDMAITRFRGERCEPSAITYLGEYSYESDSGYHGDGRQKRYYVAPPNPDRVEFDLYRGHEGFVHGLKDRKKYFSNILKWIQENAGTFAEDVDDEKKEEIIDERKEELKEERRKKREGKGEEVEEKENGQKEAGEKTEKKKISKLPFDFVCRRGLLTNLLTAPYDDRNGLKVLVCRFRGTLYLLGIDSEEATEEKRKIADGSDLHKRLYGGFKYVQYLTAENPGYSPNPDAPVDSMSGYYKVMTRKVGRHRLLFSGEIDAEDPNSGDVEFKTQKDMPKRYPTLSIFPYIKWWAQTSSVGIDRIVVGMHSAPRKPEGIVRRLKVHRVAEIPAQKYRFDWKPDVCYNFLDLFFDHLWTNIKTDDSRDVYLFDRPVGAKTIKCTKVEPDSSNIFLPDWYVNWNGWE